MNLSDIKALCENYLLENGADSFQQQDNSVKTKTNRKYYYILKYVRLGYMVDYIG
jgi:hypothetical protein